MTDKQDNQTPAADDFGKKGNFQRAVGRRKTAVAKVRLFKNGKGKVLINNKTVEEYFPYFEWKDIVEAPLKETSLDGSGDLSIKVLGGGKHSQAEAVRHGISRAIVSLDEDYRKQLRGLGFLTRDSRMKERKKPGLKRARRAPQWAKR